MRILFVNTNIGYGGASKMISCIANALCEVHQVRILTFRSDIVKQTFDERVSVVHDKLYTNKIKPLEIIGQIIRLRQYIKKNDIDLVIAFLHPANYMSVIAARGTKAKVLLSERGDPVSRMRKGKTFVHTVEKIIRQADAYVFQSEGAMRAYPPKCRKKGRIIVNAVPDREYPRYSPAKEKYILCAARIELVQKRQDVLVDAFEMFWPTHRDYRLLLAGDGPDLERLKAKIDGLGTRDRIELLGARKDVYQLMAGSAFFVLSSDYEGLPNVLLEAMAVGTPCVSTDCSPGGARMIIDDGVDGFIVPCGDPRALSEKMCALADDDRMREEFSKRFSSKVTLFSQDKIDRKWLTCVEEVCGLRDREETGV